MSQEEKRITRRTFFNRAASLTVGAASLGVVNLRGPSPTSALSYERILGSNDRILLGHVGIGNRGRGLERSFRN